MRLRNNYQVKDDGNIIYLSDVNGVELLPNLKRLDLRFNAVQDISPIANLSNLENLDVRENGISDISELAKVTSLTKLNLRGNELVDIRPLENLKNLSYLNLHSNINIASIEPLKELTKLRELIIRNVPIGDQLQYIANMNKLKRVNFQNCGIRDPQVLIELMSQGTLQDGKKKSERAEIDLLDNELEYSDFEQYTQLKSLWDNIYLKAPYSLPRPLNDLTVSLSHPSGFYEEEFDLTITCDEPNVRILYTLDGSEPDIDNIGEGKPYKVNYNNRWSLKLSEIKGVLLQERRNVTYEYKEPIRIKDRTGEPDGIAGIITTYRVRTGNEWKPPKSNYPRGTTISVAVYNGKEYSETSGASYLVFEDDNFNLPVVSTTSDSEGLFGYYFGICVPGTGNRYVETGKIRKKRLKRLLAQRNVHKENFNQRGKYWRRNASAEYLHPSKNNSVYEKREIKISGNVSRINPHKGITVTENNRIDKLVEDMDSYTMRAGGHFRDFLRDSVCSEVMMSMNVGVKKGMPVIQFINGEYFGIVNLIERFDDFYFQSNYGVESDNLIVIREPYQLLEAGEHGFEHYNELHRFMVSCDIEDELTYKKIKSQLDIDSFIDYILSFTFLANHDWGGRKHFRMWRSINSTPEPYQDGRWRYCVWDFDYSLRIQTKRITLRNIDLLNIDLLATQIKDVEQLDFETAASSYDVNTDILARLVKIPEFRKDFVKRALWHMEHTFEPSRIIEIIDKRYDMIKPELQRYYERWNNHAITEESVNEAKRFARERPAIYLEQLKNHFPEQFIESEQSDILKK